MVRYIPNGKVHWVIAAKTDAAGGIDYLVRIDNVIIRRIADALGESLAATRTLPGSVADCVQIGSEEALIPDLDVVQSVVASAWKRLSR